MSDKLSGGLRQEQAAATRQKLLDSAQRLFAEKGYKGTPVREINRSVNLADGLLYHYFPDGKKEIFQAVVVKNVEQILNSLEDRNRPEKYADMALDKVLEQIYINFIEVTDAQLDVFRIMFRENEVKEFVTKEQMMKLAGEREQWLPKLLRSKYESGEVRDMDFETAALMLNSVLMNHMITKLFCIGPSRIEREESRRRLIAYQVSMWKNPQP